eukprot:Nk52_evm15s2622 gene=Nk52_evmTU15s2622
MPGESVLEQKKDIAATTIKGSLLARKKKIVMSNDTEKKRRVSYQNGEHVQATTPSKNTKSRRRSVKNREMHNLLEKNRRAHMKACFDELQEAIPYAKDSKLSTISVLTHASNHVKFLNNSLTQGENDLKVLEKFKSKLLDELGIEEKDAEVTSGAGLLYSVARSSASSSSSSSGNESRSPSSTSSLPRSPLPAIKEEM